MFDVQPQSISLFFIVDKGTGTFALVMTETCPPDALQQWIRAGCVIDFPLLLSGLANCEIISCIQFLYFLDQAVPQKMRKEKRKWELYVSNPGTDAKSSGRILRSWIQLSSATPTKTPLKGFYTTSPKGGNIVTN